jgi:hypothetical protein
LERRAWIRYGCESAAVCRPVRPEKDMGWMARVRDISAGGVGLLLRHRFRPGTPLLVELNNPVTSFRRILPVRVMHATPFQSDGTLCWLVGCAFTTVLREDELQALR